MRSPAKMVVIGYGAWVAFNVLVTVFQIGDAGVGSQLALVFTGFPLALLSLLAPHGSTQGVVFAGALGLAQWFAIVKLNQIWSARGKSENGT